MPGPILGVGDTMDEEKKKNSLSSGSIHSHDSKTDDKRQIHM